MKASPSELLALAAKWRARARTFRREAAESGNIRDIHRTYPSLIERGLRQPTIGIFIEIAVALRMEPATLITMTMARLRADPP